MISKRDLYAMIEVLNSDISALEHNMDVLQAEVMRHRNAIADLKKHAKCPVTLKSKKEATKLEGAIEAVTKRGRGRPRKNA